MNLVLTFADYSSTPRYSYTATIDNEAEALALAELHKGTARIQNIYSPERQGIYWTVSFDTSERL